MNKDITLTNSCILKIHTNCINVFKSNIKNFNMINGYNYSLNDIKEVAIRKHGITLRLSEYDCISIYWDEIEYAMKINSK